MISFKSFVTAIHEALISASDSLMDKNVSILDKYFIETSTPGPVSAKNTLIPKTVILEYPHLTADGKIESLEVAVPLITLVPLTMSQIEKATFIADFEMDIIDGELQLNFSNSRVGTGFFKKKPKVAKLEITLAPQETPEGLKLLVEGYEAILKRQIS